MLQFVGVSQPSFEKIELDDYIPLVIRWGEQDFYPKLYWSIADESSLLEIVIDAQTQVIRSVKVTLARKYIHPSEIHIDTSLSYHSGVPICNTDFSSNAEFREGYFREKGTFELHIGKNHAGIIFSDNSLAFQIVSGRVRFGLDKNNYLCMMEIVDFTDEDMAQLTETLKYQSQ